MKILHVNNSAEGGGTESYIRRIVQRLNAEGHSNHIYVQTFQPGNHPVKARRNTRKNIRMLTETIRHFSPDVIHVHNINNYRILDFLLKSRPCLKSIHEFRPFCTPLRTLPGTHVICNRHLSLHCFTTGCFPMHPLSFYRYMADRRSMRVILRYPALWVMSRYMGNLIRPLLPDPSVLEIVPYFYDPPSDEPPPVPSENRIFTAGRLVRGKGFDELLTNILPGVKRPFHLRIAGDGPERHRLERMAGDLGLNVEFLGALPSEQLVAHYCWSRLVVFPSTYPEPFGIVGLEAMGAGRPVVAFDVGGIADWLNDGENGYLIPPGDSKCFAQKINDLLESGPDARVMGSRGRTILLDRFSSSAHLAMLEKTYQRLAEMS